MMNQYFEIVFLKRKFHFTTVLHKTELDIGVHSSNIYTMVCLPVGGDNPLTEARGLSPRLVDYLPYRPTNCDITTLYHCLA